jgi:uncharacterized alpha-E superfamily protein
MLRGTFLEHADNTARLLDVKFHALAGDYFGSAAKDSHEVDFYHWSAILRSVSGFEVYRKVYRNVIRPERVAELLILRPDMPRSLAACMNEVVANLELAANQQSSETRRRAGRLRSDLQYGRIDEILATGLHAYLSQFLDAWATWVWESAGTFWCRWRRERAGRVERGRRGAARYESFAFLVTMA